MYFPKQIFYRSLESTITLLRTKDALNLSSENQPLVSRVCVCECVCVCVYVRAHVYFFFHLDIYAFDGDK
jgi:hypothetical protein